MNWAAIATIALSLVPTVVKDVEGIIAGAKQGATKKQLALSAVQAATGIADQTLTGTDKTTADAVSSLVSQTIDATVATNNATGVFTTSSPTSAPAPDASAAPAEGVAQSGAIEVEPVAEAAAGS